MIVPIITVADAAAPTEADLIKRNKVDETLFAAIAAEFICPKTKVCNAVFNPHSP